MNCEMVEECLLDYIEGQLDPSEAEIVRAHLAECPPCRIAHRDTKELVGALHVAREEQDRRIERSSTSTTIGSQSVFTNTWTGGTRLGDFEILDLIGRGGMGAVYRARQVSLGRVVALKVLSAGFTDSKDALIRFSREAQAAAKLHHTNIVPVYAQGEHDGHFYYAMEKIDGVDLGRVLKTDPARIYSHPTLVTPQAEDFAATEDYAESSDAAVEMPNVRGRSAFHRLARLIAQVADALAHAHRHQVLHRDIKPQNLLLGQDGQLHITDFGLARMLDEPGMTITGEIIGTPAYMSPEQIDAERDGIDHRTDIYSLGVTLYELLTGQRPFDGPTREQTIARIRQREPKSPRKINPNIPIDLETICLRAMEKEPRRRYASAEDMAKDLLRYADDKPILSRRVGPIEKMMKWVRRHPAMTTILTLTVILCVGAAIWAEQTIQSRLERADDLVRQAIDSLTYEDYRNPAEPLRLLAEASSLNRDARFYHVGLGMCQLLDDPAASIRSFRAALDREPSNIEIMYLLAWACRLDQHLDDYQAWLDRAEALGGARTAKAHFYRGQAMLRLNPKAAIADLTSATNQRDSFYQAILHLGRALNTQMYHDRKVEDFSTIKSKLNAACELRVKAAYPRYLLSIAHRIAAEIYERAGDAEESKTNFEEALRFAEDAQNCEPSSPRGYACEAEYWESRGKYEEALDARDRGAPHCDTPATQIELFEYRWRVCYWLGRYDRAKSDLTGLVRIAPPTDPKYLWEKHFFTGLIDAEEGRLNEACQRAEAMAAERPSEFRAVTSAAAMLSILGRPEASHALLADRRAGIQFAATATPGKPERWFQALYDYAAGDLNWYELEQLADEITAEIPAEKRDIKLLWAEAHFFAGAKSMGAGDRAAAVRGFEACERTFDFDDYCYLSRIFVRRMRGDPSWPKWLVSPGPSQESDRASPLEASH